MIPIRQTAFTGGEISPTLYARTDLDRYRSSLRKCRNFIPTPHGAAKNRPGTKYVAEVKDSTKAVRLEAFLFSSSQTFVLEFGDHYIRWHQNGAPVLPGAAPAFNGGTSYVLDDYVTSGGIIYRSLQTPNTGHTPASSPTWWAVATVYEVYTPYVAADLARLKFTQSGDVIWITHQNYGPYQLKRLSSSPMHWTMAPYTLPPTSFGSAGPSPVIFNTPDTGLITDRMWSYIVSSIHPDGERYLGVVSYTPAALLTPFTVGPGNTPVFLQWAQVAGALEYRIYRLIVGNDGASAGVAGLLDQITKSSAGDITFADVGNLPDYAQQPPQYVNVFGYGHPAAVAFFEQRLVFAGLPNYPTRLFLSQTNAYNYFGDSLPARADEGIDITLASNRFEEIRSLVQLRRLLAFTSEGVWAVSGGSGEPISPTSIEARMQYAGGASWLTPIAIGNDCFYVQERGQIVRNLAFQFQTDSYTGNDLTILARHLFDGQQIVDWAYQQMPYSIIWAVRGDGLLLSLTYVKEHDVWAWAWHDAEGSAGFYENVCVVPEGNEDAVYVVVRRTVNGVTRRYVERFASRQISDLRLANFLDCALSYSGVNTGATTVTLSGLTGTTAGSQATVTASANLFALTDVGDQVVILNSTATPIRCHIIAYTSPTVVTVEFVADLPSGYTPAATTDFAMAHDTLSGLGHLEGKTVNVLADGNTGGSYVVTGGVITLGAPAVYVQVGLRYFSELELLDLSIPGSEARTANKTVRRVCFEVEATRGIYAGQDFDHLTQWKDRAVKDSYGTVQPTTGLVEVNALSNWNKGGRAVLRQADPLPVSVLSAIREVELGGS